MKKALHSLGVISLLIFFSSPVQAKELKHNKEDVTSYFDIDLTGYELYSFGDFNQLGYKITPLTQLFLGIIQTEGQWIDEPRLYIKGDKGYFHLWKEDGTNVLYTVEKENSYWKTVKVERKRINRIPVPKELLKEVVIERLLEPISKAVHSYYKEPKLWDRSAEKILDIRKDEESYTFYVTVQVQTFEGAHNPPYGEDTITFHIKGNNIETLSYKHRDISEWELKKLQLR